jgi:hypothetical protein
LIWAGSHSVARPSAIWYSRARVNPKKGALPPSRAQRTRILKPFKEISRPRPVRLRQVTPATREVQVTGPPYGENSTMR